MRIDVKGTPAPQGSKRHVGNGVMIESSKKVKPWRQDVKYAALEAIEEHQHGRILTGGQWNPMAGAVDVTVSFYLARPKGHYRTGKNSHLLRDAAPRRPAGKPDLDKLLRSTLDALGESGIWGDDSQVVEAWALKYYADDRPPGAVITVLTSVNTDAA